MQSALISIVMPSFNQSAFIEASILSVLQQDWDNLELIIADGGSTDGTVELLKHLAAGDARLRWISESDTGPANALNKAITMVRGTLIGWLNSDDLYTPGALRRAAEALEANPSWMLVYGHGEHVDEVGKSLEAYPTLPASTPIDKFAEGCFICQPTVFFRRTLPVLIGKLDEKLSCAFDFEYWLRAFKKFPDRIGFIDVLQAQSRLHNACITNNQRRRVALEGMAVLHRHLGTAPGVWIETYLEELLAGIAELELGQGIRESVEGLLEEARPYLEEAEYRRVAARISMEVGLDKGAANLGG